MNTIPLTNEKINYQSIPYIMSGVIDVYEKTEQSIGIILVHDPDIQEVDITVSLKEYLSFGIKKIYLINKNGSAIHEDIKYDFPNVICLEFNISKEEHINLGLLINIAFQAVNTDLVFLSWTHINPYGMSSCLLHKKIYDFPLCIIPHIEDSNGYTINSSFRLKKQMLGYSCKTDENPLFPFSLFPCMGVGIYNRKKFLSLNGYDSEISNFQHQLVDFGFRAYYGAMDIRLSPYYRLRIKESLLNRETKVSSEYHLIAIKFNFNKPIFHALLYIIKNIRCLKSTYKLLKKFYHKKKNFKSSVIAQIYKEYWSGY